MHEITFLCRPQNICIFIHMVYCTHMLQLCPVVIASNALVIVLITCSVNIIFICTSAHINNQLRLLYMLCHSVYKLSALSRCDLQRTYSQCMRHAIVWRGVCAVNKTFVCDHIVHILADLQTCTGEETPDKDLLIRVIFRITCIFDVSK